MEMIDGGSCPGCGNNMGLVGPGGCNCESEKVPPKKTKSGTEQLIENLEYKIEVLQLENERLRKRVDRLESDSNEPYFNI